MQSQFGRRATLLSQLRDACAQAREIERELADLPFDDDDVAIRGEFGNGRALCAQAVRFEEVLREISERLVASSPERTDETTTQVLAILGQYLHIDHVQLFAFSEERSLLRCTHEWFREAIHDKIHPLQTQQRSDFSWISDRLLSGEPVVLRDAGVLPDAVAADQEAPRNLRIRSTLALPMFLEGRVTGTLWFDVLDRPTLWPEDVVRRLQLVGQILANGLARLRSQLELETSRQFVEAVSESSPNIIYVVTLDDQLRVAPTYVNRHVHFDLGRTPSEILELGTNVFSLIHPDDRANVKRAIIDAVGGIEDSVVEVEYRFAHASGEYRSFMTRNRIFRRDIEGQAVQIIGVAQDVTERIRAEEELHQQRDHLAHVARLRALDEIVASVAHEISQPLYSIVNFAKATENVLATLPNGEVRCAEDWIQRIISSARRAGAIIQRLRDYGQRGGTQSIEESPNRIVEEAIDLMDYSARRQQVHIEWAPCPAAIPVCVDAVQIQQVVVNLIQNAIESMKSVAQGDRQIVILTDSQENKYQVSVIDCGMGLPEDDLPIYDPFVTTKADGFGMGLAICRTIIENHGGRIWTTPNLGHGVTTHFSLPIAGGLTNHEE